MRPTDPVKEELRRVTANFVQNGPHRVGNPRLQGFDFLDPGNPMFSRRWPMPTCSPVGFKHQLAVPAANIQKNKGVSSQGPYSSLKKLLHGKAVQ